MIDAGVRGNAARWINHSCDPNCEPIEDAEGRIFIKAKRTIRAGEELSYNYRLNIEGRLTKRERAGVRLPVRQREVPGNAARRRRERTIDAATTARDP